jgi:F-type H+-transporting ATPase subunit b
MMFSRTLSITGTALLASPAMLMAAEGGSGGVFSVNPGLSIWTTVIFLLLLGALWKFAWAPLLGAVEAREERIQSALDTSRERHEEAEKLLAEHKAQLADVRRQSGEILAEARTAADRLRKELEEKAREEAQGIVAAARREIEREKDQALAQLREESVDLALSAAAKLLGERVDAARDRDLIVSFLDSVKPGDGKQGAEA